MLKIGHGQVRESGQRMEGQIQGRNGRGGHEGYLETTTLEHTRCMVG